MSLFRKELTIEKRNRVGGINITDCDRITKYAKYMMFNAIENTKKEHKEYFIKLCEDKDKNIIPSNICVGIYCMVPSQKMSEAKCPNNTEEIGNFHSHPILHRRETRPSKQDIISNAESESKMFCIGYAKYIPNKVENNRWIETEKHIIDCYDIKDKNILELGNKAHKAALIKDTALLDKLVNEMYSRLDVDERDYPSKLKEILNKKCTLTETKVFEMEIKDGHTTPGSKHLVKVERKQSRYRVGH